MKTIRKQRLIIILFLLATLGGAVALTLYALRQNINLFLTPTQALAEKSIMGKRIRLGGMVQVGSIHHQSDNLHVDFVITDLQQSIAVSYQGVLPDLFREGQGVIVQGHLLANGHFKADEVLAKHDENYRPPNMKQVSYGS